MQKQKKREKKIDRTVLNWIPRVVWAQYVMANNTWCEIVKTVSQKFILCSAELANGGMMIWWLWFYIAFSECECSKMFCFSWFAQYSAEIGIKHSTRDLYMRLRTQDSQYIYHIMLTNIHLYTLTKAHQTTCTVRHLEKYTYTGLYTYKQSLKIFFSQQERIKKILQNSILYMTYTLFVAIHSSKQSKQCS